MDRFLTLMRREWLQHRTGWLVVMALPSALLLLLGLIDGNGMHVRMDGEDTTTLLMQDLPVALQTVGWTLAATLTTLVLACLAVLTQLPGLARRDVQDRSIEFWRSLPTSDAQSVGATTLMHLLVFPGMALMAGVVGAQLVALVAIVSHQGPLAWLHQPWGVVLPAVLMLAARLLLGLLLAVAWLSPLLMLTLAASAWLKRWAVPVVVASLVFGVKWIDAQLPVAFIRPALQRLGSEALGGLLPAHAFKGLHISGPADAANTLPGVPMLLAHDAGQALGRAASPAMLAALLVGAAGFGVLVWHRRRLS